MNRSARQRAREVPRLRNGRSEQLVFVKGNDLDASRLIVGLALAAVATLLPGCGGSSGSGTSTTTPPPPPPPPPVSTIVATGNASFLVAPKALALSSRDGQLYVADGGYAGCTPSCILKVDPTGTAAPTVVIVGAGTIEGITFDATGDNLYYSDSQNIIGRLIWSGSAYQTPAVCDNVAAQSPQAPYHLAFDAMLGILAVDGTTKNLIQLATCATSTTGTAFSANPPYAQPRGVALGPTGEIYVGDSGVTTYTLPTSPPTVSTGYRINRVDRTTGAVAEYAVFNSGQPSGIQWLGGTSAYGNALVVAMQGDLTIVSTNGTTSKTIASFPTPPLDVAVSGNNLDIYVLTSPTPTPDPGRIYKVTGL